MNISRRASLLLAVTALSGCTVSGMAPAPINAERLDGVQLVVENPQHSRVWLFTGYQACSASMPSDLKFTAATLLNGSGEATVRAGLAASADDSAQVAPKVMDQTTVPVATLSAASIPITGCPTSDSPLRFAFEVTSDTGWKAEGFELTYIASGTSRTLVWDIPITVCGVSGCDVSPTASTPAR